MTCTYLHKPHNTHTFRSGVLNLTTTTLTVPERIFAPVAGFLVCHTTFTSSRWGGWWWKLHARWTGIVYINHVSICLHCAQDRQVERDHPSQPRKTQLEGLNHVEDGWKVSIQTKIKQHKKIHQVECYAIANLSYPCLSMVHS